eukprot:4710547-Pleurochrysis_carterae.AAC.2
MPQTTRASQGFDALQALQDSRSSQASQRSRHSHVSASFCTPVHRAFRLVAPAQRQLTTLESHSLDALCVRLSTLRSAHDRLHGLQHMLQAIADTAANDNDNVNDTDTEAPNDNTANAYASNAATISPSTAAAAVAADIAAAAAALRDAMRYVCEYTALKLVYQRLRHSLLLGLYLPSVSDARLAVSLRDLDLELGVVFHAVPSAEARVQLVSQVLKAVVEAMETVLTDPARAVSTDDIGKIEADIALLCAFFDAEGSGVPKQTVDALVSPLRALLPFLDVSSDDLAAAWQEASSRGTCGGGGGGCDTGGGRGGGGS